MSSLCAEEQLKCSELDGWVLVGQGRGQQGRHCGECFYWACDQGQEVEEAFFRQLEEVSRSDPGSFRWRYQEQLLRIDARWANQKWHSSGFATCTQRWAAQGCGQQAKWVRRVTCQHMKANSVLSCNRSITRRLWEMIPLFYLALVRLHLEYCVLFLTLSKTRWC